MSPAVECMWKIYTFTMHVDELGLHTIVGSHLWGPCRGSCCRSSYPWSLTI